MADTDRGFALRVWSLATFHTASFVASVVVGVHVSGRLATMLGRLDTLTGAAAFLALWMVTWFATRAGLRQLAGAGDATFVTIVFSTTVAGGWNGVGVLAIILGVGAVSLVAGRGASAVAALPILLLTVVVGGVLAFTVGAVAGLVYGLIDAALLRCGAALYRWARGEPA